MKKWYQLPAKEVMDELGTNPEGLSPDQVTAAQEKYGRNVLKEGKKKTPFQIFLGQFRDLLVIVLIAAAVISALTGDARSTLVILGVLVINAVLGTVQEVKAQKSLNALKQLSSPHVKVMRGGQKMEIDSAELVPGDIVIAEAGDMIAADGRIIENYSLQVNESSLTGESTNIDKKEQTLAKELSLADRVNMVYSGSLVTYGRAVICVTATGMNTEIGKIAALMNQAKERKTPLQKSLDQFSSHLAAGILVISAIVFGLQLYRGMDIMDALLFAVALAVAAIPEALGSIVTIVQAMGTQKMAREHAIIKNLSAVESLGSVSVICSDKTGTLTQNKMTVRELYIGGEVLSVQQIDLTQQLHRYLLYDAVLTNDSTLVDGKGIGDPTEYALLDMYQKIADSAFDHEHESLTAEDLRHILGRVGEVPFDSDRKLMSTKHLIHGVPTVFTKGAVDVLLERCDRIRFRDQEGSPFVCPITDADRQKILEQNQKFSERGLRVLAFSYKETEEELTLETE
ncbi:MAG: HAD-IC family P-type ATPase, partial [Eubacterium sp.]|nr:HAD-IC family P-type ATPase [Eubacterium sp.]